MNIEHPNYTLIAYKPEGIEVCMGCVTGTFSSDFQLHTRMRMDECLKKHAQLLRTSYSDQEPEYELNVLYRGIPLLDAGLAIYDLYHAALEAEVEDQVEGARKDAAQAEQDRLQAETEAARISGEQTRAKELQTLSELAQKLNYTVVPKAENDVSE